MKTCTKCKESKDVSMFGMMSKAKDGLQHRCKECKRSIDREHNKSPKAAERYARFAATAKGKAVRRRWRQNNKGVINSLTAKRHAAQLQRTPPWADMKEIAKVYAAARFIHEELGYDLPHVDHIVPLQGKTVSGLHVHTNLQLLSEADNLAKSNSYNP